MISLPLSVYAHIPFCDYRCRYCNFTFETGWSEPLLVKTLDAIVEEAAGVLDRARRDGVDWKFHTLYFGGGTPGVIPPRLVGPFIAGLNSALGFAGPWHEAGFEVNPENVTPDLLGALQEAGINRLSIGIQSFDTARLHALGRWCDRETNLRALDLIARLWKGSWSADLMTGLPSGEGGKPQTWTDLREDLRTLLDFDPPHVSLYSLTVEPGTALESLLKAKKLRATPDGVQDQLWLRARSTLQQAGYEWYEISNFAKPGRRSAHNPVYWRMDPWMGLGPGAEGNLVAKNPQGEWRPLRTRNPKLFPWLSKNPSLREEEFLTAPEFWLEHFLTGWRTSDGVSQRRLEKVFRNSPQNTVFCLTDDQRLTLNQYLTDLQDYGAVEYQVNWFSRSE